MFTDFEIIVKNTNTEGSTLIVATRLYKEMSKAEKDRRTSLDASLGLSEVHDLVGLWVHLDSAGHGAGRSLLGVARLVAALAAVVLLLHQVVAGAEGNQVRVVGGRRDRHRTCAAHVRVAELVRQALQLVGRKAVVVPKDVVVRRAARPLRNTDALENT